MVLASFLYLFIDDFFSNNQLNEWAWKVAYILLFLITALTSLVLKINNKPILVDLNLIDSLDEKFSLKRVKKFFLQISIFWFLCYHLFFFQIGGCQNSLTQKICSYLSLILFL